MIESNSTFNPTSGRTLEHFVPSTLHAAAGAATKTSQFRLSLLLIPLCIGGTLSGVITWLNLGFADGFLWHWLTSFASALPVMALGMLLMSGYDKLLQRVMPRAAPVLKKLLLAVLMAFTLELLMSSVITLRNLGWAEGFAAAWANAFLHSLPVGLAIGLLMGFVVRPWLQRLTTTRTEGVYAR